MRTKKRNALFGRYPSCDMLNNALRFIRDGKIDVACAEIVFAIRCEDCKHMHAVNLPDGQSWHYCPYMKFDVDPDFYCARGERRESGNPK